MALRVRIIGKDKLSGKLSKIGGRVVGLGKKFTKLGMLAGVAIAGASLKIATDFDKGLREVTTLMDNVTDQTIPNMSKELKKLAVTSGDSLNSLTKAKYDIVSAGFSDAAQSAQVLTASTKLAIGGVTDTAKAADLLTSALNAYGLEAGDVNDVSDMMFMTVKMGKTTMDQLAESLGQVLPFAKAGKLSLDDVGASMAVMTASGLNTAESTTALKGMIQALVAPTSKAAKELKLAGIETKYLDDGNLDLLKTLAQFEGMPLDVIRKFVPNIRAATGVISLSNNMESLADNTQSFANKIGATETAHDKMQESFAVKGAKLKQNFISMFEKIGNSLIDVFAGPVEKANAVLERLGDIGWANIGKAIVMNMSNIMEGTIAVIDIWLQMIPDIMKGAFNLAWIALTTIVPKIFKSLVKALRVNFTLPGAKYLEIWTKKFLFYFRNLGASVQNWAIDVYTNIKIWFAKAINYIAREFVQPAIDLLNEVIDGINTVNPFEDIGRIGDVDFIDMQSIIDAGEDMKATFVDIPAEVQKVVEKYDGIIAELLGDSALEGETFAERLSSAIEKTGEVYAGIFTQIENDAVKLKTQEEQRTADSKKKMEELNDATLAGNKRVVRSSEEILESLVTMSDARKQMLTDYRAKWSLTQKQIEEMELKFWEVYGEQGASNIFERMQVLKQQYEQYVVATNASLEVDKWYAKEKLKLMTELGKQLAGLMGNVYTISDNYATAEMNNINKKKDKQIAALDQMGLSEKEHSARKVQIEKDAEKEIIKVKEKKRKIARAMAVIKGVEAVMDTWEAWGGFPAGIIPAGIMAGIALSEIAVIDSQQFRHGGMVSPMKYGGDTVPAMLTPREIVSTQGASDIYGDDIIRMNQLADGEVTSPSGGQMNVTIQAMDAGSFEDYVRNNPNALANALEFLKDKRYIS